MRAALELTDPRTYPKRQSNPSAQRRHLIEAYRTVIEACNAHRSVAGIGGVHEESLMRRYIGMGVRLVLGGGDLGFMTSAAAERAKLLRNLG